MTRRFRGSMVPQFSVNGNDGTESIGGNAIEAIERTARRCTSQADRFVFAFPPIASWSSSVG
jgi:hypothetical protein